MNDYGEYLYNLLPKNKQVRCLVDIETSRSIQEIYSGMIYVRKKGYLVFLKPLTNTNGNTKLTIRIYK